MSFLKNPKKYRNVYFSKYSGIYSIKFSLQGGCLHIAVIWRDNNENHNSSRWTGIQNEGFDSRKTEESDFCKIYADNFSFVQEISERRVHHHR